MVQRLLQLGRSDALFFEQQLADTNGHRADLRRQKYSGRSKVLTVRDVDSGNQLRGGT
mgnify:CR=1 FL=1